MFEILLTTPIELLRTNSAIGAMDYDEQRLVQTAVDAYLQGETVCFLECVHKNQWKYFYEGTKNRAGKIQTWFPFPKDWPRNPLMEITVWPRHVCGVAENFNHLKSSFPTQYHRQIKSFDFDFVMPYGSWQHEREIVMQTLERLCILDRSIYSRPPQIEKYQESIRYDYLFSINSQSDPRTIEGTTKTINDSQRFNHKSNVFNLYDTSKKAHCWVVMDNCCLNDDMSGTLSQMVLYPILYGVPFIYIGNREQRRHLAEWGIQPNDPSRSTVRGVAEQMLWLQSIFQDPILAQKWQDCQGELIESNSRALKKLPDLIKKNQ